MSNGNSMSKSKSKGESFTSASGLSPSAAPFNCKSKTHDQVPSFNYNSEGVYYHSYWYYAPSDDSFENEPNSYPSQYPSKSEPYLIHSDAAASMAYNRNFKLDENTSYSSENNFSHAQEIQASGDNTTILPCKHLSGSLDSCGDAAVDKENYTDRLSEVDVCADAAVIKGENYSAFNPSAIMEPPVLQNAKDIIACHGKILIDKGKEKQKCETVINEPIDNLVMAKKDLSPAVLDDFNLELHTDKSFVPVQTSSVMSDPNDSDVDSPCWKGIGFCQSASRNSGPISSEFPKIEGESRKRLNPLAPHFFPGNAKPLVDCHGNKFEENDSASFKKAAPSVVLSLEHRLTDFVKAGTSSAEVSNAIETQFSNETHDAGKEFSPPKKLNTSSALHSLFGDGPCLAKEDLTFNGQVVTGADLSGSVKAMKPAILNGSTSMSFAPIGDLLTSFFSRDGAYSHFCETFRGASKSTPPKIDVQLVVNTLHGLSELLRWNCSNDLDSLNEHERDMIQHIIGNLCVCITNKVQQRVSISETGHPCTSYCPMKLPDRHKEFQVTKMKPVSVTHDWESQESLLASFSQKVPVSSSSRSDGGINIGNEVTREFQVTRMKPVTVSHNWESQESLPASFSKKAMVSSSSRSDGGFNIGDEVTRVTKMKPATVIHDWESHESLPASFSKKAMVSSSSRSDGGFNIGDEVTRVTKMKPVTVTRDWESQESLPASFSKKVLVSSSSRSDEGINIADEVTGEFQVTKMKPVTVTHDWESQESLPASFSQKVPVSSSSRSDGGINIGNEVTREFQVTRMKPVTVAHNWESQESLPASFSKKAMVSSSSRSDGGFNVGDEVTGVTKMKPATVTHDWESHESLPASFSKKVLVSSSSRSDGGINIGDEVTREFLPMKMKPVPVTHDWESRERLLASLSKKVLVSSSSSSNGGINMGDEVTREFQVSKMKPVTVTHDWESWESLPAIFSKKVLASSSSRSNGGFNISDKVTRMQVANYWKASKECQIVGEMHPQPLLIGNFWPDASAAPCL